MVIRTLSDAMHVRLKLRKMDSLDVIIPTRSSKESRQTVGLKGKIKSANIIAWICVLDQRGYCP